MEFVNFFASIGIPPDPVANEDTLRNHIGRIPYNTFQVSPALYLLVVLGVVVRGLFLQMLDEVEIKTPC